MRKRLRRKTAALTVASILTAALGGSFDVWANDGTATRTITKAAKTEGAAETAWDAKTFGDVSAFARDAAVDWKTGFATPPTGYGEVPFWWWTGEKLDAERLLWQIDELAKKGGISGVQINYAHQDVRNEKQPNWLTYPNDPEPLTAEWFDAFDVVAARCREYGMGVGLSGYTIDWQNSPTNLFDRLIYRDAELQSRTLYVAAKERVKVDASGRFAAALAATATLKSLNSTADDTFIQAVAYPVGDGGKLDAERFVALGADVEALRAAANPTENAENGADGDVKTGEIAKIAQIDGAKDGAEVEIWFFKARRVPQTLNPLHPEAGKTVVARFFQPFETRTLATLAQDAKNKGKGKEGESEGNKADAANGTVSENKVKTTGPETTLGLNYFFQDELQLGTGDRIWADDLAEVFAARKGYPLWAALPAVFDADVGARTEKNRLDFADLRVRLAEERYFRPIFDWHASKGRIYACDSGGRGKNPVEFGDYFSATRWYTAPGHDTPGGRADFIKNKVSASIAHFYKRPRVWLEGYHSFGWGATPERLLFASNENFLFGANLLNLHGLYYTTYGGFWEWAPPCYHFRQPYWETFGAFLKYFERASFALTRGVQRADFLVLYPVTSYQARLDGARSHSVAFAAAEKIYATGRDLLFVDDDSLKRAKVDGARLIIGDSEHRVLVLPASRGIRWSTLAKALEFYRAGGTVVALDALPEASDRAGRDDAELDAAVREIFGLTAAEAKAGKRSTVRTNENGGVGALISANFSEKGENSETAQNEAAEDGTLVGKNGELSKIRRYDGGFEGRWAWSSELQKNVFFKWVAQGIGAEPVELKVRFFCDNAGALYVGERKICDNADYSGGWSGTLKLKDGDVLTIDGRDGDGTPRRGSAGFFVAFVRDGKTVASTEDFRYSLDGPNVAAAEKAENGRVAQNKEAAAKAWRLGTDLAGTRPVDVWNVHVLHRTGVNSEANGGGTSGGNDAALWANLNEFLARFPKDVFDAKTGAPCAASRRTSDDAELFFVMRGAKGAWLTFPAQGRAEFWNAWDGSRREIVEAFETNDGPNAGTTTLRWPFEKTEAGIVVFWKNEKPTRRLTALETDVAEIAELSVDAKNGGWTARAFAGGVETAKTSAEGAQNPQNRQKTIRLTTADGSERTLVGTAPETVAPLKLDGEWAFELLPTLNNRFGDFRLPISEETLGAEARRFDCVAAFDETTKDGEVAQDKENGGNKTEKEPGGAEQVAQVGRVAQDGGNAAPSFDGAKSVLCDFGQKFWRLGPFPTDVDVAALDAKLAALRTVDPSVPIVVDGREFRWTPLGFSWRWGIEGNPGRQGYHGLKERIDSRFIGLGKNAGALNETVFAPEDAGSIYYLWSTAAVANAPASEQGNVKTGETDKVDGVKRQNSENGETAAVSVDVCVGGDAPGALFVDGKRFDFDDPTTALVVAEDGAKSPILLRYDAAGRRSFAFVARTAAENSENSQNGEKGKGGQKVATALRVENGTDNGAWNDEAANRAATDAGKRTPLSTVWFDRPGVLDFDVFGTAAERPTYWFRFVAPPGWNGASIPLRGSLKSVVVDGKPVDLASFEQKSTNVAGKDFWRGKRSASEGDAASSGVFAAFSERTIRWETLQFDEPFERAATVALEIEPEPGVCGGAVFPEPIRLDCGVGTAELGDWNGRGVLAGYSGGAKYGKTFVWESGAKDADGEHSANERIWLDLGKVSASCRVFLNGRAVGDLPTSPWRLDVSEALRPGENRLEVVVFNTLSNYYADLPSRYKGSAESGLFGPVEIRREKAFELRETNDLDVSAATEEASDAAK
ncbi:MAG: hypothetical protein J6K20_12125 [Thermoguttaceae bacterium]|nr:hypothetical protein [Thermoguttaceae bacterium]